MDKRDMKNMLIKGAGLLGAVVSEDQADACIFYLFELKKWNQRINLTGVRGEREVIIKHFLDSLAFLKGITATAGTRLIDIGSGAGFPALVIKIARPEICITMVESIKKKASFLRHMIRAMGLVGAEVIDKRTDEVLDSHQAKFDVVTARAFADMETALAVGAPFLRSGGIMVLGRGPAEAATEEGVWKAGMAIERVERFSLPFSDYGRAVWIFRKAGLGLKI